ncbi:ABC transporter ATP-binding protein [Streptococcus sp.]|uniref:ABC transporter ATP-binding protein n=1 Tax=Streptococcus sp. TaxID=1306 RepID=UPI0035A069B5
MFALVLDYVRKNRWTYLLVAVSLIVYDATLVIPTQVVQRLVDAITKQSLTEAGLFSTIGFLILATLVNYGSAFIWHLKLFQQSIHFKFDMQQRAFHKLVAMRTPFYEKFRSGDMMTRFSTDVEMLQDMVGYGLMIILYAGGMIAFVIPVMFLISWEISLVGMIPIVIMTFGTYKVSQPLETKVDEARDAISELSNEVLETVEGIRVIRAYSKKDQLSSRFAKKTAALSARWNDIARYRALYMPMYSLMLGLSTVLILGSGLYFMETGQVSLGQVVALQLYVVSLVEPFAMLSDFILVYQTGKTSFGKLQELIETGDDMEEDGRKDLDHLREIRLEDYSFSYAQASQPSLKHISLTLKAGQTLGLVGKTGAGKTSLVRQFLRQYPVGEGTFTINGRPITDYSRKSLEALIGYVPQEHVLFSRTVWENIAMGKVQADQEEIKQAISTAAFEEDVERMADGLDTTIGERGVSISGGQKQRISIARAFIREPELLILDDSLSAVDARTERQIIQNIQQERAGKTNIIVTHRLSAVHHADWVLVLDEGRIIEEGTPDQLLAQEGWYYQQYQRQQAQGEEE